MKKIILSALVAVCAMTANAQAWFGGSVGFSMTDGDNYNETQTDFGIKPEIGYTLNENWDVAVGLGFGSITNQGGVKDNNATEFTIAPYARYTFAKSGIASFFVDGGFPEKSDEFSSTYESVELTTYTCEDIFCQSSSDSSGAIPVIPSCIAT